MRQSSFANLTLFLLLATVTAYDLVGSWQLLDYAQYQQIDTALTFQFAQSPDGSGGVIDKLFVYDCFLTQFLYDVQDDQLSLNFQTSSLLSQDCTLGPINELRALALKVFSFQIAFDRLRLLSLNGDTLFELVRQKYDYPKVFSGAWAMTSAAGTANYPVKINGSSITLCGDQAVLTYTISTINGSYPRLAISLSSPSAACTDSAFVGDLQSGVFLQVAENLTQVTLFDGSGKYLMTLDQIRTISPNQPLVVVSPAKSLTTNTPRSQSTDSPQTVTKATTYTAPAPQNTYSPQIVTQATTQTTTTYTAPTPTPATPSGQQISNNQYLSASNTPIGLPSQSQNSPQSQSISNNQQVSPPVRQPIPAPVPKQILPVQQSIPSPFQQSIPSPFQQAIPSPVQPKYSPIPQPIAVSVPQPAPRPVPRPVPQPVYVPQTIPSTTTPSSFSWDFGQSSNTFGGSFSSSPLFSFDPTPTFETPPQDTAPAQSDANSPQTTTSVQRPSSSQSTDASESTVGGDQTANSGSSYTSINVSQLISQSMSSGSNLAIGDLVQSSKWLLVWLNGISNLSQQFSRVYLVFTSTRIILYCPCNTYYANYQLKDNALSPTNWLGTNNQCDNNNDRTVTSYVFYATVVRQKGQNIGFYYNSQAQLAEFKPYY